MVLYKISEESLLNTVYMETWHTVSWRCHRWPIKLTGPMEKKWPDFLPSSDGRDLSAALIHGHRRPPHPPTHPTRNAPCARGPWTRAWSEPWILPLFSRSSSLFQKKRHFSHCEGLLFNIVGATEQASCNHSTFRQVVDLRNGMMKNKHMLLPTIHNWAQPRSTFF